MRKLLVFNPFFFFKQMKNIHCKKAEVQHKTWAFTPSKAKTPSLPRNAATTWWLVTPCIFHVSQAQMAPHLIKGILQDLISLELLFTYFKV
jgi:hypothetical protein